MNQVVARILFEHIEILPNGSSLEQSLPMLPPTVSTGLEYVKEISVYGTIPSRRGPTDWVEVVIRGRPQHTSLDVDRAERLCKRRGPEAIARLKHITASMARDQLKRLDWFIGFSLSSQDIREILEKQPGVRIRMAHIACDHKPLGLKSEESFEMTNPPECQCAKREVAQVAAQRKLVVSRHGESGSSSILDSPPPTGLMNVTTMHLSGVIAPAAIDQRWLHNLKVLRLTEVRSAEGILNPVTSANPKLQTFHFKDDWVDFEPDDDQLNLDWFDNRVTCTADTLSTFLVQLQAGVKDLAVSVRIHDQYTTQRLIGDEMLDIILPQATTLQSLKWDVRSTWFEYFGEERTDMRFDFAIALCPNLKTFGAPFDMRSRLTEVDDCTDRMVSDR